MISGLHVYFLCQIREVFFHNFQISFQLLALPLLLLHPCDSDVGMFGDVPEAPYIILGFFFKFVFLLAVLVECFFLPYVPNC